MDYNNEFLKVELYRALFNFEKNLREQLMANEYNNESFIAWIKNRDDFRTNEYLQDRYNKLMKSREVEKREKTNEFETFNFRELLEFARDMEIIQRVPIDQICSL